MKRCVHILALAALLHVTAAWAEGPPLFEDWHTFTTADGLPNDRVTALDVTADEVWIGTEGGLAVYHDGRIESFTEKDGLVHPVISGLSRDPASGDLWIATFGGVSRFSGGRFESFTQLTSGLVNDVVYAIAVEGRWVWVPTAAGTSRYDTWNESWQIWNNRNAPMHEIWCYGVAIGDDKVYLAVWGGGVLQFAKGLESWREFRDPDGEMELDLLQDDGPVSDVVASVAWGDGILWAGTYFGANRFDGRRWSGYTVDDSGLPSDFINFVRAEGKAAWFATEDGLAHFDGSTWTVYRRRAEPEEGGTITFWRDGDVKVREIATAPADNFFLTVARRGDEIWVGTEKGLSWGRPAGTDLALSKTTPSTKTPSTTMSKGE